MSSEKTRKNCPTTFKTTPSKKCTMSARHDYRLHWLTNWLELCVRCRLLSETFVQIEFRDQKVRISLLILQKNNLLFTSRPDFVFLVRKKSNLWGGALVYFLYSNQPIGAILVQRVHAWASLVRSASSSLHVINYQSFITGTQNIGSVRVICSWRKFVLIDCHNDC